MHLVSGFRTCCVALLRGVLVVGQRRSEGVERRDEFLVRPPASFRVLGRRLGDLGQERCVLDVALVPFGGVEE